LLTSYTDIELWNATAQGNQQALGELFRRYYGLLFQYGKKICSDTELLEDSIQDLFAEIWQKRASSSVQSVKPYLLQALKFKLYKAFRDQKRINSIDDAANELFELSHENFIVAGEEDKEKMKKILEAINSLPARQKEIIYLKIYKGLSYEEVSEIMEINYQVVRNLLCQALKSFRKLLMFFV
jgi:RNA polymerase sigma factor (sigma-70 family)